MLTIELCEVVIRHPVHYCDNPQTPLLGYDVMPAMVIDTGAKCVWSSLTTDNGCSINFTNSDASSAAETSTAADSSIIFNSTIAAPPTAISSTTTPSAIEWLSAIPSSVSTSTTADASTTLKEYSRRQPCESPRPLHPRLTASSSPNFVDLSDSARVTTTVTSTSNHVNSTHLDPLASSFMPRFVSTPPTYCFRSPVNPDPSTSMVEEEVHVIGESS